MDDIYTASSECFVATTMLSAGDKHLSSAQLDLLEHALERCTTASQSVLF